MSISRRHRRAGVAQQTAHHRQWQASRSKQRGMGMAQIVQPAVEYLGFPTDGRPMTLDVNWSVAAVTRKDERRGSNEPPLLTSFFNAGIGFGSQSPQQPG